MKVRIGFGLGVRTRLYDAGFAHLVDELERLGFDSLWLSERLGTTAPDPLAAMAFGAGRTTRIKFGMSVMVLPGRNPVVLAKSLASLATLSGGRLLPAFGMGAANRREHHAFGVDPTERAARMEEALAVMRHSWTGEPFDFHGEFFDYESVQVLPRPKRMDVWLGGDAPSTLERVGRLADGWLPSFITPSAAAQGRVAIERAAAQAGRHIDDDHYGVLIPYSLQPLTTDQQARLMRRRPDANPTDLFAVGWEQLRELIGRFVAIGTTKFVVVPMSEPATAATWTAHLEAAANALFPLET